MGPAGPFIIADIVQYRSVLTFCSVYKPSLFLWRWFSISVRMFKNMRPELRRIKHFRRCLIFQMADDRAESGGLKEVLMLIHLSATHQTEWKWCVMKEGCCALRPHYNRCSYQAQLEICIRTIFSATSHWDLKQAGGALLDNAVKFHGNLNFFFKVTIHYKEIKWTENIYFIAFLGSQTNSPFTFTYNRLVKVQQLCVERDFLPTSKPRSVTYMSLQPKG